MTGYILRLKVNSNLLLLQINLIKFPHLSQSKILLLNTVFNLPKLNIIWYFMLHKTSMYSWDFFMHYTKELSEWKKSPKIKEKLNYFKFFILLVLKLNKELVFKIVWTIYLGNMRIYLQHYINCFKTYKNV